MSLLVHLATSCSGWPVVIEPVRRDAAHQSRASLPFAHWTVLHVFPPQGENRLHPSVIDVGRLRTWDPQQGRRHVIRAHALVDKSSQVLSNQINILLYLTDGCRKNIFPSYLHQWISDYVFSNDKVHVEFWIIASNNYWYDLDENGYFNEYTNFSVHSVLTQFCSMMVILITKGASW
jgi:hypothetical protein